MFWAFSIMGIKSWNTVVERRQLDQDFVHVEEGISILPEDSRIYMRTVQDLPEESQRHLLPRVILAALQRFESTKDVQNVRRCR